jgi:hypothetical protein
MILGGGALCHAAVLTSWPLDSSGQAVDRHKNTIFGEDQSRLRGLVRFADPSPAPDLDNKPLAPPRRRVPQGSELKPLFHAIPQLLRHDIAAELAVFPAAWCAPEQDVFLW